MLSCVFVFLIGLVAPLRASCVLHANEDFSSPSPALFRTGHSLSYVMVASSRGDVRLRRGEALLVACPGAHKFVVIGNRTLDVSELEVRCVTNTTFSASVVSWSGPFKELRCNQPPWFTTETDGSCGDGLINYKVGYRARGELQQLYTVCFDPTTLRAAYVTHRVGPETGFVQAGPRPNFVEGSLFGEVLMSKVYKKESQRETIRELLGEGMDDKYITKKQYLTRGHLSPRADWPLRAQQRASFWLANAAPQWSKANAGDWAALEEAVRRRARSENLTLTVLTGTHGVLTLHDAKGNPRDVYLALDNNGNLVLPVPLYFYKVVYEPRSKTATAFITINSPYLDATATSQLTFCESACARAEGQFPWLRWRSDGFHSFCCDYAALAKRVSHLPALVVTGLFH